MKTFILRKEDVNRTWYEADLDGKILGRAAVKIARVLMGKHKVTYTPHTDDGDYVIVLNSDKIAVTGKKLTDKIYYHHSGYPGGLRERTLSVMLEKTPEEVIRVAVKRMLPKNKIGRHMLKRLKVYTSEQNPHEAQQPQKLEV